MKNLTEHANSRYIERTSMEISRKEITKHIKNGGEIIYAKKLSATKSLAYVPIYDEIFKIIINRKTKVIVSILPFNDLFITKIKFHSNYYGSKDYEIVLFPDCFNETQNMSTLTKIFEVNYLGLRTPILFNHPYFEGLFNIAMKIHKGTRRIIDDEEIATKIKKETIEFKSRYTQIKNETGITH